MSPSLQTARPVWVWSFPAIAIILSFLWYRKKRGSLKTDSGGAGETEKDQMSVESEEESAAAQDKSVEIESVSSECEELKLEVVETVDRVKFDKSIVETIREPTIEINLSTRKEEKVEKVVEKIEEVVEKEAEKGEEKIQEKIVEKEEGKVEEKVEEKVVEKEEGKVEEKVEEKVVEKEEGKVEEKVEEKVVEKEEGKVEEKVEEKVVEKEEGKVEEKVVEKEEGKVEKKVEEKVVEKEREKVEREKEPEPNTDAEILKVIEKLVIPEQTGKKSSKSKCGKKKKFKEMAKKSSESTPDRRKSNEESAASILEQKLAKLDLATQHCNDNKQTTEDVTERDSANNSPSEVMLASPSVSGYSDTHSEGSSDSGKGCSEMLTPSRTPASGNSVSGDLPVTSIYEFVIPQQLVGRLIGRHGSYVNEIKETTHASIYIKRHPDTPKLKICAVEGSQMDIESALDMIRRKFPKKRYPNVTLEQVVISPEPQMIPIISEQMQLYLIEGINNDVILSSLVSAGHFFLQQPTHPTYLSLSRLNQCMMYCYSEPDQPTLPEGVGAGILCAAPVHDGWYRAQIISMDAENNLCDVKFVDYGGYMTMPVSALRQIRVDFVNLPFQASECYLAGVKPVNEDNVWCEKAKELVEKLTFGKVLQAQVYGYSEDSVPLIYLYTVVNDEIILINQELVDRGFAEWLYSEPVTEEVEEMGGSELEETEPVAVTV